MKSSFVPQTETLDDLYQRCPCVLRQQIWGAPRRPNDGLYATHKFPGVPGFTQAIGLLAMQGRLRARKEAGTG